MKEIPNLDRQILKKFLEGDCTVDELRVISKYLDNAESNEILHQLIIENTEKDWKEAISKTPVIDKQMLNWQKDFVYLKGDDKIFKTDYSVTFNYFKYAAAVIGFLIGIYYLSLHYLNSKNNYSQLALVESKSNSGEVITIQLADSSLIYLNAKSKLKYPTNFKNKTREVYLEGEAFFDIKHKANQPFIVHTEKLTIQVLGTSFDIKTFKNEKEVSVSVASGLVGVKGNDINLNKTQMLKFGKKLIFNKLSNAITESNIDTADINFWVDGTLLFDNESLENIALDLERWYGISIKFENENLRQLHLNLKQKNEPIETVLKALSISGNFSYTIEGKQVKLK